MGSKNNNKSESDAAPTNSASSIQQSLPLLSIIKSINERLETIVKSQNKTALDQEISEEKTDENRKETEAQQKKDRTLDKASTKAQLQQLKSLNEAVSESSSDDSGGGLGWFITLIGGTVAIIGLLALMIPLLIKLIPKIIPLVTAFIDKIKDKIFSLVQEYIITPLVKMVTSMVQNFVSEMKQRIKNAVLSIPGVKEALEFFKDPTGKKEADDAIDKTKGTYQTSGDEAGTQITTNTDEKMYARAETDETGKAKTSYVTETSMQEELSSMSPEQREYGPVSFRPATVSEMPEHLKRDSTFIDRKTGKLAGGQYHMHDRLAYGDKESIDFMKSAVDRHGVTLTDMSDQKLVDLYTLFEEMTKFDDFAREQLAIAIQTMGTGVKGSTAYGAEAILASVGAQHIHLIKKIKNAGLSESELKVLEKMGGPMFEDSLLGDKLPSGWDDMLPGYDLPNGETLYARGFGRGNEHDAAAEVEEELGKRSEDMRILDSHWQELQDMADLNNLEEAPTPTPTGGSPTPTPTPTGGSPTPTPTPTDGESWRENIPKIDAKRIYKLDEDGNAVLNATDAMEALREAHKDLTPEQSEILRKEANYRMVLGGMPRAHSDLRKERYKENYKREQQGLEPLPVEFTNDEVFRRALKESGYRPEDIQKPPKLAEGGVVHAKSSSGVIANISENLQPEAVVPIDEYIVRNKAETKQEWAEAVDQSETISNILSFLREQQLTIETILKTPPPPVQTSTKTKPEQNKDSGINMQYQTNMARTYETIFDTILEKNMRLGLI